MDGAWSPLALSEPVRDHVRIGRRFHLVPLVPLVGRGDGAIVAVVSRERGNLYRMRSGRLVELDDLSEEQPRRHDQGGWSQARYQRSIDNQAIQHVQSVAGELQRQLKRQKGTRAVVVSTEEMRPEFESALDQESLAAVVGWTNAESHASANDLLATVTPVLERSRRELEDELVARWREESGKGARAASGWEATLEAASDARVQVLLYADGVRRKAWQCPQCSRVAASPGNCPLDGTQMEEHDDAVDLAVCRVLEGGGTVTALRDRSDLDPVEGIGALLRF
jgi:peptide chain release factor subunit 1